MSIETPDNDGELVEIRHRPIGGLDCSEAR
jgi:hypothetical protein